MASESTINTFPLILKGQYRTMETREVVAPAADVDQEKAKSDISHVEKLREQQLMPDFDPEIDRQVTRKFDLHIMPWLFGIW